MKKVIFDWFSPKLHWHVVHIKKVFGYSLWGCLGKSVACGSGWFKVEGNKITLIIKETIGCIDLDSSEISCPTIFLIRRRG